MATYTVEFGHLGDGRPVPDLTITTDDVNEFHRAVAAHAIPYMRPVLEEMGHPEAADCFFHATPDMTAGQFMWLDLAAGKGGRFCAARITAEAGTR
ncbi:hypothetical protein [Streptomyces sp. SBT349]|uniref:hypothetical protein n=1 Tax=Streptomyces sp. SBT349 TaxID=1580539 RepID=UPI00066CBB4C|nr:hypothetical protein [Streptomyces sp. SBT349]